MIRAYRLLPYKSQLRTALLRSNSSFLGRLIGEESNVASKDYTNRWAMVIPAFATHMCLGAPYAWSIMADQITREVGFVAPVMNDWTLMEAAFPLSV
jgi:hypothetical protein